MMKNFFPDYVDDEDISFLFRVVELEIQLQDYEHSMKNVSQIATAREPTPIKGRATSHIALLQDSKDGTNQTPEASQRDPARRTFTSVQKLSVIITCQTLP